MNANLRYGLLRNTKKMYLLRQNVASKGLEFAKIEHVINYDMPKEIEDYGKVILFGGKRK